MFLHLRKNLMLYFRVFLALILLTLPYAFLTGTTAPELSVTELTLKSDAILLGKVISVESRVTSDGRRITTCSRVLILERYKCEIADSIIIVETAGGTIGRTTLIVSGEARFLQGEKVVLFLKKRKDNKANYRPVGLSQGKFNVVQSEPFSDLIINRDLSEITLLSKSKQSFPKTLKELIVTIKAVVNREKKQ
jgi:hypothetical protein